MKMNKIAAAGLGLTLALGGIAPAFAATQPSATNGTAVTANADGTDSSQGTTQNYISADSTQISATVPTEVHFLAKASGELETPTDAKIVNNGVSKIHVTSMDTTSKMAGVTLDTVANAKTSASKDVIGFTTGSSKGGTALENNAKQDTSALTEWNLDATDGADDGTDTITLSYAGHVSGFDKLDANADNNFADTVWTLAAGYAK